MYYLALSICKNEADAQDIVGETIVKAFEARNQLRNDARFKYWIMKILTNTAYTYLKRKKRLVFEEPVEEIVTKNENSDHGLWAKVMGIEEKYRMVIILYYEQEFSTREISKILNIPEGTVRSRLARAREKLKDILEAEQSGSF
jgi:RNA polymerase sigma factor, sigma-70 family